MTGASVLAPPDTAKPIWQRRGHTRLLLTDRRNPARSEAMRQSRMPHSVGAFQQGEEDHAAHSSCYYWWRNFGTRHGLPLDPRASRVPCGHAGKGGRVGPAPDGSQLRSTTLGHLLQAWLTESHQLP